MKKFLFTLIMASSAFLCAQSYEPTHIMLDPFFEVKEDNHEHSILDITNLESSRSSKRRHSHSRKHHSHSSESSESGSGRMKPNQLTLAHGFFTTESSATLAAGSMIPLETTHLANGITLNADGSVTLAGGAKAKAKLYLVHFSVSADAAGASNDSHVALFLNDVEHPGTRFALNQDNTGTSTGLSGNTALIAVAGGTTSTVAIKVIDETIRLNPIGAISANLSIVNLGITKPLMNP